MKLMAFFVSAALSTSIAYAKDDLVLFSIRDALETHEGKTQLDPGVKLYFADQEYPKADKILGTWITNKKFPLLNKQPKSVCEYTFLDALKELQRRALKEGGNAVVKIESYYKKMSRPSNDKYMCGVGYVAIGVALRGTVIKVKEDEIK